MNLKRFKKKWSKYKIIPFGEYCLPRVITTINGLKPSKQEGEMSYPFDLCFSEFNSNLELLINHFDKFYDGLEYNTNKKVAYCWWNKQNNMLFNHDFMPLLDDFKQRYDNRIQNLYNTLNTQNKHLFFIVATWVQIPSDKVNLFITEILKYRNGNSFSVIIINQSAQKVEYKNKNVYCINLSKDKTFRKINTENRWVEELKDMTSFNALYFNYKTCKKISRIIKTNMHKW